MEKKEFDYWELGYLFLFGIIFVRDFLTTTMIHVTLPRLINWGLLITLMGYTCVKVAIYQNFAFRERIISLFILGCISIAGLISGYHFLIYLASFIVGAKDVHFEKILNMYIVLGIFIMLLAFMLSRFGIIEDLNYLSSRGNRLRHSFGSIYPTDFAAHIFYLSLAIVSKGEQSVKTWKLLFLLAMGGMTFAFCDARTSAICLLFMAFALGEYYFIVNYKNLKKICFEAGQFSYIVCATFFIGLSFFYKMGNSFFEKLNQMLSLRLQFSNKAINEYGFSIFGQFVEEFGLGGSTEGHEINFFIDDSYLRILIEYGVVVFVLILVMFWISYRRLIQFQKEIMAIAFIAISFHCFMEHHMIEIVYNPFVLVLFSNLENKCKILPLKNEDK